MATKNKLAWLQFVFWEIFLKQKSWENLGKFRVSSVNSTKFLITFWLNFTRISTPKKKETKDKGSFHLHYFILFIEWISIYFIPLFDVYEFLLENFVSWHGHMDVPTCQNIGKEIVWEHETIGSMLLLKCLTCE